MPYYETVFIARPDLSDSQVKELTNALSDIVKKQDGKIHKTEHWGLRTLAYRINKSRKGHYVLLEMEASAEASIELERNMRLHDDVMRSLTTRIEALTEGKSIMMQGSDKSDREAA